jgi:glycosyltransferase involved in cell wall biosynthesis
MIETTLSTAGEHPATTDSHMKRVLFLGRLYAGHRTRFNNLKRHTSEEGRITPSYREISGWVEGGLIERAAFLPRGLRGRVRALAESLPVASLPKPDLIWTSGLEAIAPLLASQRGPLRRPLLLDLDSTVGQLEEMSNYYFSRPAKHGLALHFAHLLEQLVWRQTTRFLPWSNWTARDLESRGIPPERITVLPPGVDLEEWRPEAAPRRQPDGHLRLLFVGGDFVRKGGDMLLNVLQGELGRACRLDIVTRDQVPASGENVRVHRAEANTPELRALYAQADLFVLPSRAECFGIAVIEAMAMNLPVVMSDVGGAADIVSEGETGWLIEPTEKALADALRHAVSMRAALPDMGRRARHRAEERFDGCVNDRRIVDIALYEIERWRTRRGM